FDQITPVSVTLHDLIPLLNPDHYLKPNPRYSQYYQRKVKHLKKAALYLTVSESSRQEGLKYLDGSEDRFVNTLEAIESRFKPLQIDDADAGKLCQKYNLTRPFVLYTGGADERKNLPRLIQAFAAMPASLRTGHQLLLAGKMSQSDLNRLQHCAKSANLKPDELCVTGYVTDEELVQLYNLCKLFVFPSWHEGFGLPALEAMACGAPVIGANTSSLPEVIALEAAMFDPLDISAITTKMASVLEDDDFRNILRDHGLRQAKQFSWDKSARCVIAALEKLHEKSLTSKPSNWSMIVAEQERSYRRLIDAIAEVSYALSDKDLMVIAECIAGNRELSDRIARTRELPESITWRLEGPFDSSYSLALLNRETARALDALGHHVILHSTEGLGDFLPNKRFLSENPDVASLYNRSLKTTATEPDVTSRNLYPPRVSDMRGRLNFLHEYGWEETGFPFEWVEAFNLSLQGVTVMSNHVEKIMIDNGVNVPISVSEIGVDHWLRVVADTTFRISARKFRFLHVSSCFPRKGADVMLEAYGRAFRASDDVTLIIKTFANPHNEIHHWLEDARGSDSTFPEVLILEDDFSDAQLKALYEQCDVLVAPSRAEGFGLPMAEAMLSELAVITTGWSGQVDFCTPETAWLVDYSFERAKTHFGLFCSAWASPDVSHLAQVMREVFDTPLSLRKQRSAAGRKLLLENFCWSHVAQKLVASIRNWASISELPHPHIGWVTTWNTRCGIAIYSKHLTDSLPAKVHVFAARSSELTGIDFSNVTRSWDVGENDVLYDLATEIDRKKIDVLVIQFNYGFFNFRYFSEFLHTQLDSGRKIILTFHATTDQPHVPQKKLVMLKDAFARCHRLIVHSPADMNRLKKIGLVDNVVLFPLGIKNYMGLDFVNQPETKQGSDTFTIGSYGFFLPHKGLIELIKATAQLKKAGRKVALKMVNAEYPIGESARLITQAHSLVKESGLSEYVQIITDFLPDEQCFSELSCADLVVYPYANTAESASAAVRYGMSLGKPVAVTPISIFDDVRPAVFTLPGTSVDEITLGIGRLIDAIERKDETVSSTMEVLSRWRKEHDYTRLGQRLYGMIQGIVRKYQFANQ
ncbi:MAG TPA: glycosyltransferase, partial [Syntrophomonas sp.]|nr:glycosyltransferase [Syntrophomonas sp.]